MKLGILIIALSSLASVGMGWRSVNSHQDIWLEQDANARTVDYFRNSMTATQMNNFTNKFEPHNYDNRYLRWWYLLAPDPLFITYYNVNNNPR